MEGCPSENVHVPVKSPDPVTEAVSQTACPVPTTAVAGEIEALEIWFTTTVTSEVPTLLVFETRVAFTV
jgi:hypothetical protein